MCKLLYVDDRCQATLVSYARGMWTEVEFLFFCDSSSYSFYDFIFMIIHGV